jgi:hypothetical protein
MRIAACFAFMYAIKIEVGDLVVVHDTMAGKVLGKFLSKTGNEIYDVGVVTNWGVTRVAQRSGIIRFLDCGSDLRKAWISSHTDLRSPGYITD